MTSKLHQRLIERSPAYADWHKHEYHGHYHWALFLLASGFLLSASFSLARFDVEPTFAQVPAEYTDNFDTNPYSGRWTNEIKSGIWDSADLELDIADDNDVVIRYATSLGSIEHEAQVTAQAGTGRLVGPGVRLDSGGADDGYGMTIESGGLNIYRWNAGARTAVGTVTMPVTFTAGNFYTMRLAASGAAGSSIVSFSIWVVDHGPTKPADPGWIGSDSSPHRTFSDSTTGRINGTANTQGGIAGRSSVGIYDDHHDYFKIRDISARGGSTPLPPPPPPPPPAGDTTLPAVSVTLPTSGSTVSGTSVSITANATDNVGVVGVQFRIDGTNLGVEDPSFPYSTVWNSTTATDGTHTITAVARDASGNTNTSSGVAVFVSNTTPPPPTTPPPSTTPTVNNPDGLPETSTTLYSRDYETQVAGDVLSQPGLARMEWGANYGYGPSAGWRAIPEPIADSGGTLGNEDSAGWAPVQSGPFSSGTHDLVVTSFMVKMPAALLDAINTHGAFWNHHNKSYDFKYRAPGGAEGNRNGIHFGEVPPRWVIVAGGAGAPLATTQDWRTFADQWVWVAFVVDMRSSDPSQRCVSIYQRPEGTTNVTRSARVCENQGLNPYQGNGFWGLFSPLFGYWDDMIGGSALGSALSQMYVAIDRVRITAGWPTDIPPATSTPTPPPPPPPTTPTPPSRFGINDRIQTTSNVQVRSTAAGTSLGTQNLGAIGTVASGPTYASLSGTSYWWWNVNFDTSIDGWVVDDYLSPYTAPTPPPTPTPTPTPTTSANYPLELVSPRAVGTSPTAGFIAIPAGHRIFKAYPGLQYNIRAVVIGGSYPYTFSLTNAPSGMSINSTTGEITWSNPQANATPTITVTDAEGTQRSSSWTITVTTVGFKFVSASAGEGGSGTLSSPWNTMADVRTSGVAGDFVYFRTGTYNSDGIGRSSIGSPWERVEFNGSVHPMVWMAYPGESPVIDFGYRAGVDPSALIRFQPSATAPLYLEGLRAYNFRNIGFQVISGASDYTVLRKLIVHNMIQGVDGENPAGIMTTSNYGDASQYGAIQDSEFYNLTGGGALKIYSHKKLVIEGNLFRDADGGFDLKAHVPRFDVRNNVFQNIRNDALFGNMNTSGTGEPATGEIRYNNINTANANLALDVNQDGQAGEIFIHRNTLVGPVTVRNTDSADGPFHFYNNVIVNNNSGTPSGSHINHVTVSDPSRIILNNNLTGYPSNNIIDASGNLTSAYSSYVGTHGHYIVGGSTPTPTPIPPPPPPPSDTTLPTVSLTTPTAGSTVSGTNISITANATDNVGVVGVQFRIDGTNLGVEDPSFPYLATWNTTTATNGSHTLTAVARDAAGNTTTSNSVIVTVSNAVVIPPPPPPSAGLVIFDDFEYPVGKFDSASAKTAAFTSAGWSGLKDEQTRPGGAKGYLSTVSSIPGYTGSFPSGGSRVLLIEALPTSMYSGSADTFNQTDFYLELGNGTDDYIPGDVWFQFWAYPQYYGSQLSSFGARNKFLYPCNGSYGCHTHLWIAHSASRADSPLLDPSPFGNPSQGDVLFGITESAGLSNIEYTGPNYNPYATGNIGQQTLSEWPRENRWTLVKMHFNTTRTSGNSWEMWLQPMGGSWTKVAEWIGGVTPGFIWDIPSGSEGGHRTLRMPSTWGSAAQGDLTNYDAWLYMDDFAMATSESALPTYSGTTAPPPPPPPPTTPPAPTRLSINSRVQADSNVNVRSTAAGTSLGTQNLGAIGTVAGGPTYASLSGTSYWWWNVNFDTSIDGWVVDDYLSPYTAPTPPPTPPPTTPPPPTTAANYPLQIIQPQPNLTTNSRYYKAYPGILYRVPIGVFGGAYPFTYSLVTAPSGMTIDQSGIVNWPNPATSGSPHAVTVRVTDAAGTSVTRSWTITVTTSGFLFIDAVNGTHALGFGCSANCGTGTISNPFRTLLDVYRGTDYASMSDATFNDYFMYFRGGTHGLEGFFNGADALGWSIEWRGQAKPHVWLAYPGETVVVDHNLTPGSVFPGAPAGTKGAYIDWRDGNSDDAFIHGITFRDAGNHVKRMNGDRIVLFENTFFNLGPGLDGANSSFIMFSGPAALTEYYPFVKNNLFDTFSQGAFIKTYGTYYGVFEGNTFRNGSDSTEGLAIKGGDTYLDARANTFDGIFGGGSGGSISGNQHGAANLEIRFNNIMNAPVGSPAIRVNHDGVMDGPVYIHRNTFEGEVLVRSVDGADGPFSIYNNVVVNSSTWTPAGSGITYYGVTDPSRITATNNLAGTPSQNIIDANGNLTSAYSSYLGTHGHQLVGGASPIPPPPAIVLPPPPPAGDTTPPTTSITSPVVGATVSSSAVTVSANASDNIGVSGVQFRLDGTNLGAEDTSAPYSITWNTTLTANGSHTLTAVARDAVGNSTVSSGVSVNVSNITTPPPTTGAPVVSNFSAQVRQGEARFRWNTDRPATSQIQYGPTTAYGSLSTTNSLLRTSHEVVIPGFTAGTYNARAISIANNLSGLSNNTIFTVRSRPPRINTITASPGSIILNWSPISFTGYSGVAILRSTTGYFNQYDVNFEVARVTGSSYTDQSVVAGTTYYYSLFVYDDQENYSDPATVSFVAPVSSTPTTPTLPPVEPPVSSGGGGGGGGSAGSTGTSASVPGLLPANFNSLPQSQKIAVLTAKILELQILMNTLFGGAGQIPVSTSPCSFTRDLSLGSVGEDVKCLQKYLNANGYAVAVTGNGSLSNESTYFGPSTRAALIRWQKAYGVSPFSGYFGSKSRAQYSSLPK